MTLYPVQDAFIRGEISPRLHSRASLDLYRAALAKCENFITLPHGGLRKRGGTMFVGPVKYEDKPTRVIDFKFSEEQAYVLEIGDFYVRVYAFGGFVVEIAAPWAAADLRGLQYVQSADVMWVVHPNYPPQKIERRGLTDWAVVPVVFKDGPFGPQNTDESIKLYANNLTGLTTITANQPIFNASDVGTLIRLDMESYQSIPPWEPNGVLAAKGEQILGMQTRYDGNVYVCQTEAPPSPAVTWRYGNTPPTHLRGSEKDGPIKADPSYEESVLGVNWLFLHSGYGVARVTSITDAYNAQAEILLRMPIEVVGSGFATSVWRKGAFGEQRFPNAVTLFEERLVFASRLSVYASKTGDFEQFAIGEKDDDGLEFPLAANEANDILWLADADGFIVIGTAGGVRALSGSGIDEALTPSSFKNRSSATHRCSGLRPLNTGQSFLYVANGFRTIAEMALGGNNRFESADASQISEHIAKVGGGIRAGGYQEYPDPIAWFVLNSGALMGFTHQREQEVRGFHQHLVGGNGKILDVAVTPGQNSADDVTVIVERTINGVKRQYIETLQSPAEYVDAADGFFVDSALRYSGSPVSAVAGLTHLEGELVDILADGKSIRAVRVVNGQVRLPDTMAASTIVVGLPFEAEASTLELDVGARDGSLIGRRKRVGKVILSLFETDIAGLTVSSAQKRRWEEVKLPSARNGALFTGNIEVPIDDSWEGQGRVIIRHTGPGPCTIRCITPAFDNEP